METYTWFGWCICYEPCTPKLVNIPINDIQLNFPITTSVTDVRHPGLAVQVFCFYYFIYGVYLCGVMLSTPVRNVSGYTEMTLYMPLWTSVGIPFNNPVFNQLRHFMDKFTFLCGRSQVIISCLTGTILGTTGGWSETFVMGYFLMIMTVSFIWFQTDLMG